jgi:hypothetical protein
MPSAFPLAGWDRLVLFLGVLALACFASLAPAQQPQRLAAPELDGGVGWIGTDNSIHLKDLRGKIVVFDFWTLC